MQTDLRGRVKNTNLPLSKPLLPLFDAIVNSIHALEEVESTSKYINVIVERDKSQGLLFSESEDSDIQPITTFKVIDNGVGFNQEHFNSFLTSDTTLKALKGSKGIGRFLWLKAFALVSIESTYKSENEFYHRKFDFGLSENGVTNLSNLKINARENKTIVSLINLDNKYRTHCPLKIITIAKKILEHCLIYFLSKEAPIISVTDDNESIIINNLFNETIQPYSQKETFQIKSKSFIITNLKFYLSGDDTTHKLHYCAQNRVVLSEDLSKSIPNLNRKLRDVEGTSFIYLAYLSGNYLDERVNPERTNFNLIDESELDFPEEITKASIKDETLARIKNHLSLFLQSIKSSKDQEIEQYVITKAPQYRPLLKHKPETLDEIPPGLSEEKLDIELYRLSSKIELELREKSNEILNSSIDSSQNYPEYLENYNRFIEQFNDFGKSRLAQYIVHRKIVLDLFSNNLKKSDEDDRYKFEKDIHELIFPLRKTSDDVGFEKQNLWIIDEKLAYHKYLASDKCLNQSPELLTDSNDRPDIIIFNQPFAFVTGELPYKSIVIIEFKRPMRKSYSDEEDPIRQVYGYVSKIKSSSVNDKNGRVISIPDKTPFYCYIICDLTKGILESANNYGLKVSADHLGYFGYNSNYNAYMEIMSFDKVVLDAKQRNNILFDKLQLPINPN